MKCDDGKRFCGVSVSLFRQVLPTKITLLTGRQSKAERRQRDTDRNKDTNRQTGRQTKRQ